MKRIEKTFAQLKLQKKCALIGYICAGDPDYGVSLELLKNMPAAGCDIVELGVPFLDPAGDGPVIEAASKRAIENGASLKTTLQMVAEFRKINASTPVVLMGYYNPFLKYGLEKIFADADLAGVDGVLIVDLPFEERDEIAKHIKATNLDFIDLIAPLTDEERIKKIAGNASGFLYLISMLGVTGTKQAVVEENKINLQKIRNNSDLPVAIGFGIQEPAQAREFADIGADGVVIGSVIVKEIYQNFVAKKSDAEIVKNVCEKISGFATIKN